MVNVFADAVLALDDSVPNGTYVDMCQNLPVCDPEKIDVPVLIPRGQHDGIAGFVDLIEFFKRLPNPDKLKNYRTVHLLLAPFFGQPDPVYCYTRRESR